MSNRLYLILKEFWPDFVASEKDFRNPSPEFLMRFYEKFFDECAIYELRLESPEDVLYPDQLNESIPTISTCAFLTSIFSQVKGTQFVLEDIIEPNPKRSLRQIEILTNFLAYVDCHAGRHSTQAYDYALEAANEKQILPTEVDEIKEKLNDIAMRKANRNSQQKMLEESISENYQMLSNVTNLLAKQEEECKLLNEALLEDMLEIESLEKEEEKELEEMENLREKIVSSPDAVSREIAELSVRKREMESDQVHLKSRAKQMTLLDINSQQLISMIQSKLPQVSNMAKNLMLLRELEKGLIEDETAVKTAKEKIELASERYCLAEKDLAHLDQEREEFQTKSSNEYSSVEKLIQQMSKQKVEAEDKLIQHGAQQVLIAQEINQLMEEIKVIESKGKDFMDFFNEKEQEIYDAVANFEEHFREQMKAAMKNLGLEI